MLNYKYDLFVSFAFKDQKYVSKLVKALRKAGVKVWFSSTQLREKQGLLDEQINEGLNNSKMFLAIISPNYLKAPYAKREYGGMLAKETAGSEKRIVYVTHNISIERLILRHSMIAAPFISINSSDGIDDNVRSIAKYIDVPLSPFYEYFSLFKSKAFNFIKKVKNAAIFMFIGSLIENRYSFTSHFIFYFSLAVSLLGGGVYFFQRSQLPLEEVVQPVIFNDKVFTVKGISFTMKPVLSGKFFMGGNTSEFRSTPQHWVRLSKSFWIGETEVTQELFKAVTGKITSGKYCGRCPVTNVTWDDVQEFINNLNEYRLGIYFRLPTEAEWEFAARGGNNSIGYDYSGGDEPDSLAWVKENSSGQKARSHEVAQLNPNELGLYDMSGNVWEWCQDWFEEYPRSGNEQLDPSGPNYDDFGDSKVLRGGCWSLPAKYSLLESREMEIYFLKNSLIGFRIAGSPVNSYTLR